MPIQQEIGHTKGRPPLKVALISTFGPNSRGISPYSDGLAEELEKNEHIQLHKIDYKKIFPDLLYPTSGKLEADNPYALIHYAKPNTWKQVFDCQPELVHLQYWTPFTAIVLLNIIKTAQQKNIPTVLTVHNTSAHESLPLFSTLEKKLYSHASRIICHTQEGADSLKKNHPQFHEKISVIPHGVWIKNRSHALPADQSDYQLTKLSTDKKYILYFGNIRHYKGVDLLLTAWESISKHHPDTELIIAGRTWEGSNILSSAVGKLLGNAKTAQWIRDKQQHPLQTVYKLGFIEDQVLDSLLKISALAIFPYRKFDAQSGAASRAASIGTPIVVTNKGGLPDLCIDQSYICETLDPKDLASIIHEKLKSSKPEDREQQIARVLELNWNNISKKHTELYLQLANPKD